MSAMLSPTEQKAQFQAVLREFGQVVLLMLVLAAGGWYLWQTQRPTQTYWHCSAEKVRSRMGRPAFVEGNAMFTGGVLQSAEQAHNGSFSVRMTETANFALETRVQNLTGESEILIRVWRYVSDETSRAAALVAEVPGTAGGLANKAITPVTLPGWEQLEIVLPADCRHEGQYLKVYCWNPSGRTVYFDDLEILLR